MTVYFDTLPDLSEIDDPLLESVLIALFTDQYVPDADLPYQTGTNGGWHGDAVALETQTAQTEEYSWGSKLWTLDREKINEDTPEKVKKIVENALEPLLLLKEINNIGVSAERFGDGVAFSVAVDASDGLHEFVFRNIKG